MPENSKGAELNSRCRSDDLLNEQIILDLKDFFSFNMDQQYGTMLLASINGKDISDEMKNITIWLKELGVQKGKLRKNILRQIDLRIPKTELGHAELQNQNP